MFFRLSQSFKSESTFAAANRDSGCGEFATVGDAQELRLQQKQRR
jgi:hypothetical protein